METKTRLYFQFLVLPCVALFVLVSVFFTETRVTYAQAKSSTNCNLKVDKDGCLKKVESQCSTAEDAQTCEQKVAVSYIDVDGKCQSKKQPQICQQRLKDECASKKGKKKDTCEQTVADRFTDNASLDTTGLDGKGKNRYQCGKNDLNGDGSTAGSNETKGVVKTKFNFGCTGDKYGRDTLNPIIDVLFALIRFLTVGVGIVLVASVIWAGIQYSSSQGNPEQTQQAKLRIQNAVIGLILYLFIFALVQYLVPGGLFT